MHTMNRRMFLMRGAAASALLTGTRYLSGNPLGLPIGCQTYPVRKSISTDFAGTMKLPCSHDYLGQSTKKFPEHPPVNQHCPHHSGIQNP